MRLGSKGPLLLAAAIAVIGATAALAAATQGDDGPERSGLEAQAVTAPVQRRPLETSVVVRGSVVNVDEVSIIAPTRSEEQSASVVTGAPPATGSAVRAGSSVIEVNGRPIVLLAMSVPLFRDITPGTSGPDVVSLQAELRRLGFDVTGDAAGVYGAASQSAVGDLFEQAGYEPAYVAGNRGAFDAGLAAAERAVADARSAADRSRAGGAADPLLDAALSTARQAATAFKETQGVELRTNEAARISEEPAVVAGAVPTVGELIPADRPVVTLAAPQPAAQAHLTPAQTSLISPKSVVQFTGGTYSASCTPGQIVAPATTGSDAAGNSSDGSTDTTEPSASSSDVTAQEAGDVTILLTCNPKPTLKSLGSDYVATVKTRVAAEGLVVPATAVISTPSGRAFVEVADRSGAFGRVPVTALAEAGGFVSIEASPGDLKAGDRVRVSRR